MGLRNEPVLRDLAQMKRAGDSQKFLKTIDHEVPDTGRGSLMGLVCGYAPLISMNFSVE